MRTLLARLVVVVSILSLGSVSLALAPETRIALVIGNSHYTAVSPLPNPTSDAQTVAQALRAAGFNSVQVENNLGFDAMRRALHTFLMQAKTADWTVVY